MNAPPPIPTYWTGQQALEVVDFLEQIIHAIWLVHGSRMTRVASSASPDPTPDDDLDSLPF